MVPYSDQMTNFPVAAVIDSGPAFVLRMGIRCRLVEAAPVALEKGLRLQIGVGFAALYLVRLHLSAEIDFVEVEIDFRALQ